MKSSSHRLSASSLRGFTIIELLVAVGVTALLVSLMLTIVVNVLGGWNRSSGTLSAGNQARLVLDQLARDFQSTILKRDGNVWVAATIQQSQTGNGDSGVTDANWSPSVLKPSAAGGNDPTSLTTSLVVPAIVAPSTTPAIDDYRFGQGGVWLRLISTCTDTNDGSLQRISAPRAVAYQIVRLPVVSGSEELRYQLFRSEVRPGHADAPFSARSTFALGYNLFNTVADSYNTPSTVNSGVSIVSGVDNGGEPGSIRRPDRNQLIANNVVDFGVRFWVRNAAGTLQIAFPQTVNNIGFAATTYDGTNGTTAATPPSPASGAIPVGQMSYGFPEVAEVFVRILTDEGATLIQNLEDGKIPNSTGKWWEIVLANSRIYTRRIEIKASSL